MCVSGTGGRGAACGAHPILKMTLGANCKDVPHSHNDHFIYVLEGEALDLSDIADKSVPGAFSEPHAIPLKFGMAAPIPAGHHFCATPKDTGCSIIFFERK